MYENDNSNLRIRAYIYRKQNMSIHKNINLDTNWKDPMIPIENDNVNQVYNS